MYTCAICTWAARQQRAQHRCSATHPRIHTHTHTHTHTHIHSGCSGSLNQILASHSGSRTTKERSSAQPYTAQPYIQTRTYKPACTNPYIQNRATGYRTPQLQTVSPPIVNTIEGKNPKKTRMTRGVFFKMVKISARVCTCVCVCDQGSRRGARRRNRAFPSR